MMRPRGEPPGIREIQILRNQETGFALRSLPDDCIAFACKPFFHNGLRVVAHRNKPWC